MNKKMLTIIVIIAVVAVSGIAVVAANYNPDMKVASFDGIKMDVPKDAKFTQTLDGFEDNKYGISVKTFKNNESMVSFLKDIKNGKMISVENQPPNSVAFKQGDSTYILVTNGNEGLCVGAVDQDLDVEMANSIEFSNGHKAGLNKGFFGIGAQHLNFKVDFNLMKLLIKQVDTDIFNINNYNNVLDNLENNSTSADEGNTGDNSTDNKLLSEAECRDIAEKQISSGDKINSVSAGDKTYTFEIVNSDGDSCGAITVSAEDGNIIENSYSHVDPAGDTETNDTPMEEDPNTEMSELDEGEFREENIPETSMSEDFGNEEI